MRHIRPGKCAKQWWGSYIVWAKILFYIRPQCLKKWAYGTMMIYMCMRSACMHVCVCVCVYIRRSYVICVHICACTTVSIYDLTKIIRQNDWVFNKFLIFPVRKCCFQSTYMHVHTYIGIYGHTHIHTYIHSSKHTHTHTHTQTW